MKEIKLSQGKVAKVDDEDFEALNIFKWCVTESRNKFYAIRKADGKKYTMHRVIIDAPPGMLVDHKDGDGLNNCRENLRIVNHSQNGANRTVRKNKYLGVYRIRKRWMAGSRKDGTLYTKGPFDTEEDAAKAYNELATTHHGSFAKLNTFGEG